MSDFREAMRTWGYRAKYPPLGLSGCAACHAECSLSGVKGRAVRVAITSISGCVASAIFELARVAPRGENVSETDLDACAAGIARFIRGGTSTANFSSLNWNLFLSACQLPIFNREDYLQLLFELFKRHNESSYCRIPSSLSGRFQWQDECIRRRGCAGLFCRDRYDTR